MIVLIAHNIRSTYNVGSILRNADGFGVKKVYFTGYTPYPTALHDTRLPHIRNKITQQIHKTALGAEKTITSEHQSNLVHLLTDLRQQDFTIAALEQGPESVLLPNYVAPAKLALILGEEVHGITQDILKLCDVKIEIPMKGHKESFNVSVATGIALYALTL